MDGGQCKLTVYFDEPFWVGVFERYEDGKLSAAKVTFGAESKDKGQMMPCDFSVKFIFRSNSYESSKYY